MIWALPFVYIALDWLVGRTAGWNRAQWLYYLLSLAASLALWIVWWRGVRALRPARPRLALTVAVAGGLLYGINTVLVYSYFSFVGVMPNFYTFEFLFDEPLNSWILLRDSLQLSQLLLMAPVVALFTIWLYGRAVPGRTEPRRLRAGWVGIAALVFFVVAQLVIHNNARFVDQCFAADITTSTNLARNVSTRWRDQVTGRSGLLARMPRPLPALDPARLRLADGRPINVLILLTESLRADGLGMYGSPRPTSPFLDSLVAQNPDKVFKYESATSNASRTFLSMPSLLSGIAPYQPAHLLHTQPLIWEYFRALGAKTFLITSQSHDWRQMKSFFKLAGIDHLYNREVAGMARGNEMGIDDRYPLADFISWLDARDPAQPFTGVLQFNGTHYPYTVDDSLQLFGAAAERDKYDNAIHLLDRRLRAVFAALRAHDLENNTLILLTSDHAEEFKEHGYFGHVQSYYRTTLWIPMFWIVPSSLQQELLTPEERGALAANRPRNVSNLDIMPTLLDFFGLSDLPAIADICTNHLGRSHLTPLDSDRIIIACNNSEINRLSTGLSVVTGHWHYILNISADHPETEELYDWRVDTAEMTNRMSTADPALLGRIYTELARHRVCTHLMDLAGVDYKPQLQHVETGGD